MKIVWIILLGGKNGATIQDSHARPTGIELAVYLKCIY